MSKKNYIAIAEIMRKHVEDCEHSPAELVRVELIASSLAGYFASENSRFDRKVFLSACGIES